MSRFVVTEDQQIVHRHNQKLINAVIEYSIHPWLKCRRGITHSHWHKKILEIAVLGIERVLLDIFWTNTNMVKPCLQIQFRKYIGASKSVEHLIRSQQRRVIILFYPIQFPVVNYSWKLLVSILQKEQRSSARSIDRSDLFPRQQIFNILLHGLQFCRRKLKEWYMCRLASLFGLNRMVNLPPWL